MNDRGMAVRATCALAFSFVITVAVVSPVAAAGPWNAQVVDAETGQPLEGVVVLAYWVRYTASLGGWAGGAYHASQEVVTGPDGRFTIGARRSYTIPMFTKVAGPEWVIFKPGYGQWRFRTGIEAWDTFDRGEPAVIELPPLKTREERLHFYRSPSFRYPWTVPPNRQEHFREAENVERAYLGLSDR